MELVQLAEMPGKPVLIGSIVEGGLVDNEGTLQVGDRIVAVQGMICRSISDVTEHLSAASATVSITVLRRNLARPVRVKATIQENSLEECSADTQANYAAAMAAAGHDAVGASDVTTAAGARIATAPADQKMGSRVQSEPASKPHEQERQLQGSADPWPKAKALAGPKTPSP